MGGEGANQGRLVVMVHNAVTLVERLPKMLGPETGTPLPSSFLPFLKCCIEL